MTALGKERGLKETEHCIIEVRGSRAQALLIPSHRRSQICNYDVFLLCNSNPTKDSTAFRLRHKPHQRQHSLLPPSQTPPKTAQPSASITNPTKDSTAFCLHPVLNTHGTAATLGDSECFAQRMPQHRFPSTSAISELHIPSPITSSGSYCSHSRSG